MSLSIQFNSIGFLEFFVSNAKHDYALLLLIVLYHLADFFSHDFIHEVRISVGTQTVVGTVVVQGLRACCAIHLGASGGRNEY